MGLSLKKTLQGVFKHVFPSIKDNKDGIACHEAAFDPDQFPEGVRKRLQKNSQANEAEKKSDENSPSKDVLE